MSLTAGQRPFPDVNGGRWQMSKDGGVKPVWNSNGHELFFVGIGAASALYAVPMSATPMNAGNPVKLFDVQNMPGQATGRFYDVSRDGQKFIVIKNPPPTATPTGASAPQQLVVVAHWADELKAKMTVR